MKRKQEKAVTQISSARTCIFSDGETPSLATETGYQQAPANFELMLDLAGRIFSDFDMVRVGCAAEMELSPLGSFQNAITSRHCLVYPKELTWSWGDIGRNYHHDIYSVFAPTYSWVTKMVGFSGCFGTYGYRGVVKT